MNLNLHIIPFDEHQKPYMDSLNALHLGLAEIFSSTSNKQISLKIIKAAAYQPGFIPAVSTGYLSMAASRYLDKYNKQNAESTDIGIILANQWDRDPKGDEYLGLMFDTNQFDATGYLGRPRECCAVFTGTTRKVFENKRAHFEKIGLDITYEKLLSRTAVHELGHIFNLTHDESGYSFMAQTRHISSFYALNSFLWADARILQGIELPENRKHRPGTDEFIG